MSEVKHKDEKDAGEVLSCRVCGADSSFFFSKTLAYKYEGRYYKCKSCGHVQTQPPNWLDEVYANLTFAPDTGMVARSITTAHYTLALAAQLGIDANEPCFDFGAGTGMLVRICRDHGMNYQYLDRYASNVFAIGFEVDPDITNTKPHLVTAFEVAEHFPDPLKNFKEIFDLDPEFIFFSTRLYEDQGPDWWYFLDDGQHVAIYTEESLRRVGEHFGYQFTSDFDIHLFSRQAVPKKLLKKIRRAPEKAAKAYRKKHGSRTEDDAAHARSMLS